VRALVVSNMRPDPDHPERGRFVRDQVAALRRLGDLDVELCEFAPGPPSLVAAAVGLRRRYATERFDVVHAHFGLTAWPALAVRARARGLTLHGTDLAHPRTRLLTRLALPTIDLVCAASDELATLIPGRRARARAQTMPCGVDLQRFAPMSRARARETLGRDPARPCLLFAADPSRPEKRHDRALALARSLDVELLALGGVEPDLVPAHVNAANAVLVPSEREGFGLAVLEALACDVPVMATPVGVHREALDGLAGTLCAPFELESWRELAAVHLADPDPRVAGRARAERFSSLRMAERLAAAWRSLVASPG
jgi:glycosyltransferase involved in cell wall biosynthesis